MMAAVAIAYAAPAVAMQSSVPRAATEQGRITFYEDKNYSGDS
jgi:hypothetical protein